jgi:hypothetical protein
MSFGELENKFEAVINIFDDHNEDEDVDEDEVIEEIRKEPDSPVNAEEKSLEPKLLYKMKKL